MILEFFGYFFGLILGLGLLALAIYYGVYALAKAEILFAIVEEGWCAIILKWGHFYDIIGPGLHWIGLPGTYQLYKRKMTFFKSVTDKDGKPQAEPHNDENINRFKTTRYPYAIPFTDEEDSKGLPLSGILAVSGLVDDYFKAFFETSDWYAEVITSILACFSRQVLIFFSYDDDIVGRDGKEERAKKTISEYLWEQLNAKRKGMSILEELYETVGFRVFSIELRSVDPPEGWRDTTLAPYKAEREKEAAKHQAEASAILFDDTNQALKTWLEEQRKAGHEPEKDEIKAKQEELRERALAKTGGYQQTHVKGLENAGTVVIGGGGNAGFLVGGGGGKGGKGGGGKKGGKRSRRDDDDRTDEEWFEDEFSEENEANRKKGGKE